MNGGPKPLWNPYVAGALLGLGLLMTFVLTGHGLGASGFTTSLAASAAHVVAPQAVESNSYFGSMFEDGANPLNSWITWQVIGVAIGALFASVSARRFRWSIDGPTKLTSAKKLGLALVGGMIAGLGARIALGCTSGLGLSGAATLATAGFLFLMGFFATGAAFGLIMKRYYA
ncbi:MAG: YeeE/YedE thiosulfate transporter family protein [Panacagrimonas sp.]|jgi:uncharacterized membrane protein YedE/YeeE